LGKSLDITVLAEGIESERQLSVLKDAECQQGQGYLLGRPMPEKLVTELLLSGALLRSPVQDETAESRSGSTYWNAPRESGAPV
jgi:predicted signal transduction protein with EAL and GGDEF domain